MIHVDPCAPPPSGPTGTIRLARSGDRVILMRDSTVIIDDLERAVKVLPRALDLLRRVVDATDGNSLVALEARSMLNEQDVSLLREAREVLAGV